MKEKIFKFHYLYMISFKCSPLFKHKRILRTVFFMTFSEISGVIPLISLMVLFFNSWRVLGILMPNGGVKSGNRVGHLPSPKRKIKRPGKAALSIAVVSLAICDRPMLLEPQILHVQIFQLWQ